MSLISKLNWNRFLCQLFLLYGEYDEGNVQQNSKIIKKSNFILFCICLTTFRHFIAAVTLKSLSDKYAYWLHNFTYGQGFAVSVCHMYVIFFYHAWSANVAFNWRKLNTNKRSRYWLQFLPPPDPKVKQIVDSPNPNPSFFQTFQYTRLVNQFYYCGKLSLIISIQNSSILVGFASIVYFLNFTHLQTELMFWPVMFFNTICLYLVVTYCFVISIGNTFFFVYLVQLFCFKLKFLNKKLQNYNQEQRISSKRMNQLNKLRIYIRQAKKIQNEVFRCNLFWKNVIGSTYLVSLIMISLHLILICASNTIWLQIAFVALLFSMQIFCIVLPLWTAGRLNFQV